MSLHWDTFTKTLFTFGKKELFVFVAGLAACELYRTYQYYLTGKSDSHVINEIKFVKNTNKPCKAHIYRSIDCTEEKTLDETFECSYAILRWMVNFIDSANESLDIAIYLITCEEFREAILRAYNRGVYVRIIADYTMAKGSGSAIPDFIKNGIPVRMYDSLHMMHRKSAIADRKVVLMGSGNWTMQALAGNWDGWIKTSDPLIVREYIESFEHQWADHKLIQPTFSQFQVLEIQNKMAQF